MIEIANAQRVDGMDGYRILDRYGTRLARTRMDQSSGGDYRAVTPAELFEH